MHRAYTILLGTFSATALCIALTSNIAVSHELTSIAGEKTELTTSARITNTAGWAGPSAATEQNGSPPDHYSFNLDVSVPHSPPDSDSSPSTEANESAAVDKEYLVETAKIGGTMTRQGPEVAIGRLHPEFAHRLAGAIQEAREGGLPSAGIFSAYRPPAFGVGGFSDKFNSLHSYGLAVDMTGIGGPGSEQAKLWYDIAAKHGVVCPYGSSNRVEWNHCQPTRIRMITPASPLRETVKADGPVDLQHMFDAGSLVIESEEAANNFMSTEALDQKMLARDETTGKRVSEHAAATESNKAHWEPNLIKMEPRAERQRLAHSGPPTWCSHLHRPRKDTCGASHEIEISKKTQNSHSRQASTALLRETRKL